MPLFFCRLNGPRPGFPGDMTEAERALMGEHAAYWSGEMERRVVVAFGPVADAAGFWGLALLECSDQQEAQRKTDADPVIRAGAGFRYDVFPMPGAAVRDQTAGS